MAGEVVGIGAAPSHPDQQPHACEHVWCRSCGKHHLSVRPLACPLEQCECPCGKVGELEVMTMHEAKIRVLLDRMDERVSILEDALGSALRKLEDLGAGGRHG